MDITFMVQMCRFGVRRKILINVCTLYTIYCAPVCHRAEVHPLELGIEFVQGWSGEGW
jgi:hypothetical protein